MNQSWDVHLDSRIRWAVQSEPSRPASSGAFCGATSGRRRTNTLPAPWCRILLGRRPAVTLALPQWKWEGTYVDGHGITAHRTVLRPLLPKSCGHHGGDRGWLTNLGTTAEGMAIDQRPSGAQAQPLVRFRPQSQGTQEWSSFPQKRQVFSRYQ
jgi:hypothetical protein